MSTRAKLAALAVLACTIAGVVLRQVQRVQDGPRTTALAVSSASTGTRIALVPPPEVTEAPAGASEAPEAREPVAPAKSTTTGGALAYGAFTASGEDVEGGWVNLTDESGRELGPARMEPGSWSLDGLHPGRWTVRAGAPGCAAVVEELTVLERGFTAHHDIRLERGVVVRIRVLDERGKPLAPGGEPRIALFCTLEPLPGATPGTNPSGQSVGVGSFELASPTRALPEGCYARLKLREPLPAYVHVLLRTEVLETQLLATPVDELVFRVDTGAIERRLGGLRARFVDARTSRALASGEAQLLPLPAPTLHGVGLPLDSAGEVLFERKQAGGYWLCFRDERFVRPPLAVQVPPGAIGELGDVRTWSRATLRGEFVDENGELVGVNYGWTVLDEPGLTIDATSSDSVTSVSLTSGGRFEITDVPSALLWFTLRGRDGTRSGCAVDASGGMVDGLVIRVPHGVRVTFRCGPASHGRLLTVADELGRPLATWGLGARVTETRLAPGRYQLWTSLGERVERRQELLVGTEPLEWDIAPPE